MTIHSIGVFTIVTVAHGERVHILDPNENDIEFTPTWFKLARHHPDKPGIYLWRRDGDVPGCVPREWDGEQWGPYGLHIVAMFDSAGEPRYTEWCGIDMNVAGKLNVIDPQLWLKFRYMDAVRLYHPGYESPMWHVTGVYDDIVLLPGGIFTCGEKLERLHSWGERSAPAWRQLDKVAIDCNAPAHHVFVTLHHPEYADVIMMLPKIT